MKSSITNDATSIKVEQLSAPIEFDDLIRHVINVRPPDEDWANYVQKQTNTEERKVWERKV